MKTVMRVALTMVVLTVALPAGAQTVDEVIEKSVAAMGGRAAFAKIKTRTMSGTITLNTPAGDIPGTIEIFNALPNKARTVIKADLTSLGAGPLEIDQRFDGQNGYVLDTLQGNRDMSGNQLDNLRNSGFPHPLVTYKETGFIAKLEGKEKLSGGEAYVIVMEPSKGGSTVRQYIDVKTMLPVRSVMRINIPQMNADVDQTTELLDYREVDGIKVPFQVASSSSVQNFVVDLTKVAHNVPIDDKLFVKP
jgi:hypothetical protein